MHCLHIKSYKKMLFKKKAQNLAHTAIHVPLLPASISNVHFYLAYCICRIYFSITSLAFFLQIIMMPLLLLLFSLLRHSASFQPFYPPGEESNGDTRTSLSIALLMSFGGAFNSSGSVPGVQVALDLINNDTSLLPGYKLGYQLMDSQVVYTYVMLVVFFCS